MNSTLRSLVFWMVLVVVVVLIWNVSTQFQTADDSVTFSEFLRQVDAGEVQSVELTGNEINGSLSTGGRFRTYAPPQYEGLVNRISPEVTGSQPWIALRSIPGEALQLCQRLDPGVTTTDKREREQLLAQLHVLGRRSSVELMEHPVAQPDGVGQGLEPHRMFPQTGHRGNERHRSRSEQRRIECDRAELPVERLDLGLPCVWIERNNVADPDLGGAQELSERDDAVPRLDRPGRRFGEQR